MPIGDSGGMSDSNITLKPISLSSGRTREGLCGIRGVTVVCDGPSIVTKNIN